MSTYFVGDIHGCFSELVSLLEKVSFSINSDCLWLAGDLVNRGPSSLEVIRLVSSLGNSAKMVLGNHDLNLIASYAHVKDSKKNNLIKDLLKSKDIDDLIHWLRQQPLLIVDSKRKIVMSHAGMYPYWDIDTALFYAKKIESMLLNKNFDIFLKIFFADDFTKNNFCGYNISEYQELKRLIFSLNVFTRMRYCLPNKKLDMTCKLSPSEKTLPLLPWFCIKNKFLDDYFVFFGHWASLERNITPKKIIALDTGCCWGGGLSMFRLEDKKWFHQRSEIKK